MKDERKRRTSAPDKYTNTSLLRGPSAILGSEIKHTRLGSIERCGIDIEQLQVVRKETGYDGLQWIVEGGFRWVCEVDGRGVEGVGYDERCKDASLRNLRDWFGPAPSSFSSSYFEITSSKQCVDGLL